MQSWRPGLLPKHTLTSKAAGPSWWPPATASSPRSPTLAAWRSWPWKGQPIAKRLEQAAQEVHRLPWPAATTADQPADADPSQATSTAAAVAPAASAAGSALTDLAGDLAMDLRAEVPQLDAKAAAGTAFAAAVLIGLASVQTQLPDPVTALGSPAPWP